MTEVNRDDLLVTTLQTVLQNNGLLTGKSKHEWVGTMTDLRKEMVRVAGRSQAKVLPQSASALRVALDRVINRVRCRGITVSFTRSTDYNRTRLVSFVG